MKLEERRETTAKRIASESRAPASWTLFSKSSGMPQLAEAELTTLCPVFQLVPLAVPLSLCLWLVGTSYA